MASVPTRAFLRHAYGCYYNVLSLVDTKPGYVMDNDRMYANLMRNYTRAVTARGEEMAGAAIATQHTNKPYPQTRRTERQICRVLTMHNQGRTYKVSEALLANEKAAWDTVLQTVNRDAVRP